VELTSAIAESLRDGRTIAMAAQAVDPPSVP